MSIIAMRKDGNKRLVELSESFNFSVRQEFKDVVLSEDIDKDRFELDFKKVKYIDSTGLGMLLLLREKAGGASSDISITNAREEVADILRSANFGVLFNIL